MILNVPKPLRRTKFDRLYSIEMNDFDVERLLPTLFNLVVTRGRNRTSGKNETKSIRQFIVELSKHPQVLGFEGRDLDVLEYWVRSVAISVGQAGRGKSQEKIEYVNPNTLLTYKTGLPKPSSRQRNVPKFLYEAMCSSNPGVNQNEQRLNLQSWLTEVFGIGLTLNSSPPFEGHYDGRSEVDIHTLLTLRLLECFDTGEISKQELRDFPPCLPGQFSQVGQNILLLLRGYRSLLPPMFISRMLMAIINLDLLTYTLRLMASVSSLCKTGKMPDEESIIPEVYLDTTGERMGFSDSLARACVDRDLEATGKFFENSLRLLTLERLRERSELLQELLPPSVESDNRRYLEGLLALEKTEELNMRAEVDLEAIREESLSNLSAESDKQSLRSEFKQFCERKTAIEALVRLLCDVQRKKGAQSYTQFMKGVGGLNRPYGVLLGNATGPRNWRYVLTDELLRTLVYLKAVDSHRTNIVSAQPSNTIRLDELLEWMHKRFGILIDRPPQELDSSSARAAALSNLQSFKRRLRQTGFFQGLSDDFNVQSLTVTLGTSSSERAT